MRPGGAPNDVAPSGRGIVAKWGNRTQTAANFAPTSIIPELRCTPQCALVAGRV